VTKVGNSGLRTHNARRARDGVPLLPVNEPEAIVTLETVNAFRDELTATDTPLDRPSIERERHRNVAT